MLWTCPKAYRLQSIRLLVMVYESIGEQVTSRLDGRSRSNYQRMLNLSRLNVLPLIQSCVVGDQTGVVNYELLKPNETFITEPRERAGTEAETLQRISIMLQHQSDTAADILLYSLFGEKQLLISRTYPCASNVPMVRR
ncbi:hypothetical protein TNCV_2281661 [Trichonephila clavipes]|nr:hypothetical protein TNCV_2281661 [Trichonephila clavipes]